MRTGDQITRLLGSEIIGRSEPSFEPVSVGTPKVINDHRASVGYFTPVGKAGHLLPDLRDSAWIDLGKA